jgi:hypothetical protein
MILQLHMPKQTECQLQQMLPGFPGIRKCGLAATGPQMRFDHTKIAAPDRRPCLIETDRWRGCARPVACAADDYPCATTSSRPPDVTKAGRWSAGGWFHRSANAAQRTKYILPPRPLQKLKEEVTSPSGSSRNLRSARLPRLHTCDTQHKAPASITRSYFSKSFQVTNLSFVSPQKRPQHPESAFAILWHSKLHLSIVALLLT